MEKPVRSNAELGREVDELKDTVKELVVAIRGNPGDPDSGLQGYLHKFDKRLTLFFGLLVGAMAASGLIQEQGAHILKAIFGA